MQNIFVFVMGKYQKLSGDLIKEGSSWFTEKQYLISYLIKRTIKKKTFKVVIGGNMTIKNLSSFKIEKCW